MKKKRVVIFTTDLYQGGVAESTRKIANMLCDIYDVDLIVYDTVPLLKNIDSRVRILRINMPLSAGFSNNIFTRNLKRILRLPGFIYAFIYFLVYKIIYRPQVVYSLMYIPNLINLLTSDICRSLTIISERQDPRKDLKFTPLFSSVLRRFYLNASVVHVNSVSMLDTVSSFYDLDKNKLVLIDNFFDSEEIRELGKHSVLDAISFNKHNIVTSGRLSKQKGQWHLLYIMKAIDRKDVNLIILGEGDLRNYLTQLAKTLDVHDRVFFLGDVKNPHAIVAKCDLFVFSSIWESFGNSLVEAMCLSVPVVSTSCKPGPGDLIDGGRYGIDIGTLPAFEEELDEEYFRNIDSIAESIGKLLDDEASLRKYSNLASARADMFSTKIARAKFIAMFESNF